MGTIKLYGSKNAVVSARSPLLHIGPSQRFDPSIDGYSYSNLLQSFEPFPVELLAKKCTYYRICFYVDRNPNGSSANDQLNLAPLSDAFDPASVTYSTMPQTLGTEKTSTFANGKYAALYSESRPVFSYSRLWWQSILLYGLGISSISNDIGIQTDRGANSPYIEIEYDDEDIETDGLTLSYPGHNFILPIARDIEFSWKYSNMGTLFDITQTSCTFMWRASGSASIQSIQLSTEMSLTIPAGTLPEGEIEWRVTATSSIGLTSTTDWRNHKTVGLTFHAIAPQGGYVSRDEPAIFTWTIAHKTNSYTSAKPVQSSATFRYREGDQPASEIEISGSSQSITIPAGTFTGTSIQWQVTSRTASGVSVTSDWFSLYTAEPPSAAVPISPRNIVLDGSTSVVFTWEHQISTGTIQTAFDLQISSDATNWSTLRSLATSETSVSIPANTLPGGNLYWRVRTYNTDSVVGEWSNISHIVVAAAPPTPFLSIASNAPKFSVRWTQSGQQAYELRLNDTTIARRYSVESTYTHQEYLSDGTYQIAVRIQNQLGYWSEWAIAPMLILNEDYAPISLAVIGDHVKTLQWSSSGAYDMYWVYRNGQKIGETTHSSFVDNFAAGLAQYHILGVFHDNGYYGVSPVVDAIASVRSLVIAKTKNPKWIELNESMSKLRATSMTSARNVTYTNLIGSSLPSADIGETISQVFNLDCAWPVREINKALEFEKLCGETVCIKTPSGRRIIGVLNDLSASESALIVSYNATVTPIHWEEAQNGS